MCTMQSIAVLIISCTLVPSSSSFNGYGDSFANSPIQPRESRDLLSKSEDQDPKSVTEYGDIQSRGYNQMNKGLFALRDSSPSVDNSGGKLHGNYNAQESESRHHVNPYLGHRDKQALVIKPPVYINPPNPYYPQRRVVTSLVRNPPPVRTVTRTVKQTVTPKVQRPIIHVTTTQQFLHITQVTYPTKDQQSLNDPSNHGSMYESNDVLRSRPTLPPVQNRPFGLSRPTPSLPTPYYPNPPSPVIMANNQFQRPATGVNFASNNLHPSNNINSSPSVPIIDYNIAEKYKLLYNVLKAYDMHDTGPTGPFQYNNAAHDLISSNGSPNSNEQEILSGFSITDLHNISYYLKTLEGSALSYFIDAIRKHAFSNDQNALGHVIYGQNYEQRHSNSRPYIDRRIGYKEDATLNVS